MRMLENGAIALTHTVSKLGKAKTLFHNLVGAVSRENRSAMFPTRSDLIQPLQSKKKARR